MTIELGLLVEPDLAALNLASVAEAQGLAVIGVSTTGEPTELAGLDPWTVAVWIAARTERLTIAVPAPSPTTRTRGAAFGVVGGAPDAMQPVPSVVGRAHESLTTLSGHRLIVGTEGESPWTLAPRDADVDTLATLAAEGLPVLIPARTDADVEHIAALAAQLRALGPRRASRSVAQRAQRSAGIDYDAVPLSLADLDGSVEPGDRAHRSVSSTYLRGGSPGLVLRARDTSQVVDAVAFARQHAEIPLGVRSAGHGVSGRSTNHGGIVIDVGRMNSIDVIDRERRLVRMEPGATWKQVAAVLHPYGWALGSGDYGGVGVGGLATAGGIGLMSRAHGLTIDHLRAVEIVLADGEVVRASAEENPELFWGARGAGANFGIATAFEFEVDEIGDVGWAKLALLVPDLEQGLRDFGRLASAAPRDTTVFLVTGAPRNGQAVFQLYALVLADDPDVIIDRLNPFAGLGALARQDVTIRSYRDVLAEAADVGPDGHHGYGEPVSRSGFLPALTPDFARDASALLASGATPFFQLRTMGGAIADVAPDAMAFPHRGAAFQVTALGSTATALDAAWSELRRHFEGLYLSFETDLRPERLVDAFTEPGLERLRALKRRYDPDLLFRDNFPIDLGDDRRAA